MNQELEQHILTLRDDKRPWIARRDAAEVLGEWAERALKALHGASADANADVRGAVMRGLEQLKELNRLGQAGYTLEQLAQGCEKINERTVAPHGAGFAVNVRLEARHQVVYLEIIEPKDAIRRVRVMTVCGKPRPEALAWALQANLRLPQGAVGLLGEGEAARLVLLDTLPLDHATPEDVKKMVKELAFYGDWIEQKLAGTDTL